MKGSVGSSADGAIHHGSASVGSGSSLTSLSRGAAIRIVAFCAIGMSVNMAPAYFATFPIMLKPMQAELGYDRTQLTTGYSIAIALLAITGPFIGRMADQRGQRAILLLGIPALALCFALFSILPPGLPIYFILCAVLGIIGAASFQFLYYSILPQWFNGRLGVALALAGTGGGIGIALFPSYAQWLVASYGWRTAYLGIAAASLAIGYGNLFLLRVPRVKKNLSGDAPAVEVRNGLNFAQIVRLPVFWRLAVAYLLICGMTHGNFVHLVPMLTDRGTTPAAAATMMACVGVTSFLARIASGFLLLRIDPARLGAAVFLIGAVGASLLLVPNGQLQTIVAAILLGVAFGAEGELLNYIGRHVFGMRAQTVVLGAMTTAFLIGGLLGPMLMSICHDRMGDYYLAQIGLIAIGVLAAALHFGIRPSAGVIPIGSRQLALGTPEF